MPITLDYYSQASYLIDHGFVEANTDVEELAQKLIETKNKRHYIPTDIKEEFINGES